jgi:hypothetical protein
MGIDIEVIHNQFQRKRNALNKSIQIGMSLKGEEPPKDALPALAVAVFGHLQDLYDINEISLTALAVLKDEIDDMDSKNKSVEEMNKNLKKRFDTTFGSLENRLKQINDKDQSKKEEPGEFTFYG